MRPIPGLALVGLVLCGVLAVMVMQRNTGSQLPARPVPGAVGSNDAVNSPAVDAFGSLPPPEAEVISSKVAPPRVPVLGAKVPAPSPKRAVATAPAKGKDPIKDPVARAALAWVGVSEVAEAYWIDAINDPSLSAQERQDLIEDLNEDGISDPKRPALEDLPLILNRLELIELLAPEAMDQVNADAFMEAYKDLVNLAYVAVGAGEPVR